MWNVIPIRRLIRAGKGTTFCRIRKRKGRIAVSVTDLRRSNRLRWRRYANFGGTRLWIGCASGHSRGLLVDRIEGRESPEAGADVWHNHTRAAQSTRMAARGSLYPCGDGEHRRVLEADLRDSGRSLRDRGGQRAARQESSGSQDGREGCGMDCRLTLSWVTPLQLRSAQTHPRTARFNTLSSQARGKPVGGAQSVAEATRERQYQVGECGHRRFRRF